MKRITLAVSAAAVSAAAILAGTTFASAQVWDGPPGYASHRSGAHEIQRQNRYHYRGGYSAYGAYGYVVPGGRYYRGDDPPGSRFQDRGLREEQGDEPN